MCVCVRTKIPTITLYITVTLCNVELNFEAKKIMISSFCDGNVWELKRE